ncbi:Rv3654c family TadE-like protein [Sanguibacter antarcticus]|uniref:Secretion/DNA translocation related TadE-like protein n=1 Tax=Sanguibacter antarcticus TaxID=372484 RepID=A0A2A9E8H6_9MICO|nr:Rv3654c family TadE-like protein [Sanguibacter antarcticus]PFG35164.1 secretion/DNA translocation related TadE-like protein [Sanguibacter antarcticus]
MSTVVRRVRGRDREAGAGTVLLVGVVAALVLLAAFVGVLGGTVSARGAAQGAADLAALSAAGADMSGVQEPCSLADEVARRNGGTVAECLAEGDGIYTVAVTVGAPVGRTASARARAGPASAAEAR